MVPSEWYREQSARHLTSIQQLNESTDDDTFQEFRATNRVGFSENPVCGADHKRIRTTCVEIRQLCLSRRIAMSGDIAAKRIRLEPCDKCSPELGNHVRRFARQEHHSWIHYVLRLSLKKTDDVFDGSVHQSTTCGPGCPGNVRSNLTIVGVKQWVFCRRRFDLQDI